MNVLFHQLSPTPTASRRPTRPQTFSYLLLGGRVGVGVGLTLKVSLDVGWKLPLD